MAFECPRRSSPPSPMFDADTGCIATDPAPSARRRFRSKTGIENLPANEHAQETPHTPSPTRTTRRIQSGCAGSRPRLRDGMPGSPSQHIDITRAKWIPYIVDIGLGDFDILTVAQASQMAADKVGEVVSQNLIVGGEVSGNVLGQGEIPKRHPAGEDDIYQHQYFLALPIDEYAPGLMVDALVGCSAPGSLDTSLSHAAGLIEIAACHA